MSIKLAMKQYFSLRKEIAKEGQDFLFRTPYDENVGSHIYVGEVDENEYIPWKPIEKEEFYDFASLEEDLGIKIHPSVLEYFNSYWFVDLDGFFKDHYIKLESVLPMIGIESYSNMLMGYKNNHNNLENIPLGIEGNGLIVVVNNVTGSVKLEDFGNSFEVISGGIEQLIRDLRFSRLN